jgi:hypothetical protein
MIRKAFVKLVDDPQFDAFDDASDAALDRLLAQARWSDADAVTQQRLRSQWNRIAWRNRVAPAIWCVAGAVAAVMVVAIGMIGISLRSRLTRMEPVVIVSNEPVKYLSAAAPAEPPAGLVASRPANLLERMALLQTAPTSAAQPASGIAQTVASVPDHGAFDSTAQSSAEVARLTEPTARVSEGAVAAGYPDTPTPAVEQLLANLQSASLDERFAAAQALAAMKDDQVVEELRMLASVESTRREALVALSWTDTAAAARTLSELHLSPAIQAQLQADRSTYRPPTDAINQGQTRPRS